VKLIYRDRVQELPRSEKVVRRSGGRRSGLQARIAGQDREVSCRGVEGNHLHAGCIGVHLGFIQCPYSRILESRSRRIAKHVDRHVEPVGPDGELRIITQPSSNTNGEKVPPSCHRIASLGDGEALECARRIGHVIRAIQLESEIGDDPAVLECVIEDYRVAEIVGVAQVAEVALAH
jgi:hypothetical protein